MADIAKMCQNEYVPNRKPITTSNPQSNAIIKQIHQTIGNIIRTFEESNIVNNATMFAVRATYHTTLQASPMELVFGRYSILNINYVADWEHIRQRKQLRINHNIKRNNMYRNNHQYNFGDKILVKRTKNSKHKLEFMGPLPIPQKTTMAQVASKTES